MDACETAAAATAARRYAVAATARLAGVAEASVRAVRLCAESGGLVVIPFMCLRFAQPLLSLRLRLVTSRGPPYPSRSPRAHPSGWTRTQC